MRSRISCAAFSVKVTAHTWAGAISRPASAPATSSVRTLVLPDPAAAVTSVRARAPIARSCDSVQRFSAGAAIELAEAGTMVVML